MRQTPKGTWIDVDGQFAEPGTEFVFDPRESDLECTSPKEAEKDVDATNDVSEDSVEMQAALTTDTGSEADDDSEDESEFLMKDGELV